MCLPAERGGNTRTRGTFDSGYLTDPMTKDPHIRTGTTPVATVLVAAGLLPWSLSSVLAAGATALLLAPCKAVR